MDQTTVGFVVGLPGVICSQYAHTATVCAKPDAVSYTHLRAHETVLDLVCRLLLEKKKNQYKTLDILTHLLP